MWHVKVMGRSEAHYVYEVPGTADDDKNEVCAQAYAAHDARLKSGETDDKLWLTALNCTWVPDVPVHDDIPSDPYTRRVSELLSYRPEGINRPSIAEMVSGDSWEEFQEAASRKLGDLTEVSSFDLKHANWDLLYRVHGNN